MINDTCSLENHRFLHTNQRTFLKLALTARPVPAWDRKGGCRVQKFVEWLRVLNTCGGTPWRFSRQQNLWLWPCSQSPLGWHHPLFQGPEAEHRLKNTHQLPRHTSWLSFSGYSSSNLGTCRLMGPCYSLAELFLLQPSSPTNTGPHAARSLLMNPKLWPRLDKSPNHTASSELMAWFCQCQIEPGKTQVSTSTFLVIWEVWEPEEFSHPFIYGGFLK